MTAAPAPEALQARARRLLAWYPSGWRDRYGEEFAELLVAELAERPRSRRRDADVAASGIRARLGAAGLTRHSLDQAASARASLAILIWCGAAFALFGAGMWAQLGTGIQWAVPADRGITQAMDLMSIALAVGATAAVLAIAGLARACIATARRGGRRRLRGPAALMAAGAAVLIIGGRHFENAWPGTGGQLLTHQALVPGWLVAFCWAATMWITSYLGHPAALAAFPATQLAWMALSPAAAAMLVTGTAQLARRVDRSPGAPHFRIWAGYLAGAGMITFLCGALRWLPSAGSGPSAGLHAGAIDAGGLAVLVLAAVVGGQAARRGLLASR